MADATPAPTVPRVPAQERSQEKLVLNPIFPALSEMNVYATKSRIYVVGSDEVGFLCVFVEHERGACDRPLSTAADRLY